MPGIFDLVFTPGITPLGVRNKMQKTPLLCHCANYNSEYYYNSLSYTSFLVYYLTMEDKKKIIVQPPLDSRAGSSPTSSVVLSEYSESEWWLRPGHAFSNLISQVIHWWKGQVGLLNRRKIMPGPSFLRTARYLSEFFALKWIHSLQTNLSGELTGDWVKRPDCQRVLVLFSGNGLCRSHPTPRSH